MFGQWQYRATDLSELIVIQLMSSQPAECSVLLEQLQGMIVQPPANQEPWKARRQEEQGADVSLIGRTERQKRYSRDIQQALYILCQCN